MNSIDLKCLSPNIIMCLLAMDGLNEVIPQTKGVRFTKSVQYFAGAKTSRLGWCQDNEKGSNQESKFDFVATSQCLVKIDEGQQKIKIVRTNRQSNLRASCQSIFSLSRHHPNPRRTVFIFRWRVAGKSNFDS